MNDSSYWRRLNERRLGRRAVLKSGGILVAGLGAAALAGCGRSSAGSAKTGGAPASSGVAAGPPQKGGVLTSKVPTDPPTTWPAAGAISYNVVHPFASGYNQLLQVDPQDPDNKIIPDLADSYEIAADGKSIVFKLHPGVKFHDGSDFTSEDVKATVAWNLNPPAKKTSSQKGNLQAIDRVETPDSLTAKFVLKAPNPSLLAILATHLMVIGAKGDMGKDEFGATLLNGTGPFKLKAFMRGVSVEMERNPSYWVKDRPYLDGVRYSILFDENTAMTNLIAGRFHKYFPLIADNFGRASKESGGRINETNIRSPGRRLLFFNATKKPFSDIRVRQAVSLVLDRQADLQLDLRSPDGRILGSAPVGYLMPGGPWANPTDQIKKVPGYDKPDIAEAKKLLAAAGVTEALSGVLLTRSDVTFQPNTTYVQGTLKQALGWDYKIDAKDSASAFAATAAGQFDLCTWNYQPAGDDPDAAFGQLATRQADTNWSKVYDDEADALYTKQSQTLDTAERKKLVQQLELKYLNNFPLLAMYSNNSLHAIWNTVQNYKVPSALYVNTRYQDVWLSKA